MNRISVIIPAINEAECIERAVAHAWDAGVDEVIVVDGGSDDRTIELAKRAGATVLSSASGRAVQQNVGAEHAEGDILLFLHADNWLAEKVGEQISECLLDEKNLGGAFRQWIEAPGLLYRLLEWGNATRVRLRGTAYGDQAIFMRKSTFNELGGFPTTKLMEDLLLMHSFRKLAAPVLLPGPVYVDPRRWQRYGVIRQTLRNWFLLAARALGVSPDRLASLYPKHK